MYICTNLKIKIWLLIHIVHEKIVICSEKKIFFKNNFYLHLHVKKSCINFLHCFVLFLKLFILMEAVYVRYILYTVYLGIFRGDLIFAFFGITFKSQHIQYAEIISSNVWQKKFLNRKKWLTQIKIGTHFLLFCKFCDTRKKRYTVCFKTYNCHDR